MAAAGSESNVSANGWRKPAIAASAKAKEKRGGENLKIVATAKMAWRRRRHGILALWRLAWRKALTLARKRAAHRAMSKAAASALAAGENGSENPAGAGGGISGVAAWRKLSWRGGGAWRHHAQQWQLAGWRNKSIAA